MLLTAPLPRRGRKEPRLPGASPRVLSPRPAQTQPASGLSLGVTLTFRMVFGGQSGALLILRGPKRETKGEGRGRVGFLRS